MTIPFITTKGASHWKQQQGIMRFIRSVVNVQYVQCFYHKFDVLMCYQLMLKSKSVLVCLQNSVLDHTFNG